MSRPLRRGMIVLACLALSGCALQQRMQHLAAAFQASDDTMSATHQAFSRRARGDDRQAAQHVARPWLMGQPQPLAREVTLPAALRANVNTTLLFARPAGDLPTLARRITLATGIPVAVEPETLLPVDVFLPRLAQGTATAPSAPTAYEVPLSGQPEPLAQVLDRVSAQWGVSWRYRNQRIEFFRTETRVFNVQALSLNASAQASLGLGKATDTDGFVSTSQTRFSSPEHDVMAVVKARIEPFLSRAGVLVAEPGASASIVVTDTPAVLRRIAGYLETENRGLTRRVRLVFEEITLATENTAEAGIDWNVVFTGSRVAASLASPAALAAEAGSLGLGISEGPFKGSEAIIKALGRVGKIVRHSRMPVLTLNRRPVTHAVRTTFSYIDKIESTPVGVAGALALPAVSVSQKEETVGSLITLLPDAQENGDILLSLAYDNTVAQPLKSVTFGDRAHPLQLQQITIDGNGTVQQVLLHAGQPMLISGFDRRQHDSSSRRLNPGVPLALGGSDRAVSQTLTTVMIVTAQMEEGA